MDTLFSIDESIVRLPAATAVDSCEVAERLNQLLDQVEAFSGSEAPGDGEIPMGHLESLSSIVPFFESLLDDAAEDISPSAYALLVHMVGYPAVPDTLVLQSAFGRRIAEESNRDLARIIARANQRDLSVDDYITELASSERIPQRRVARMFRGEVRRTPDDGRMRAAIAILRRAASLIPHELRSHLLTAIGWLYWARGKRPNALAYLAEAERTDSGCPYVGGLTALVSSRLPAWCS